MKLKTLRHLYTNGHGIVTNRKDGGTSKRQRMNPGAKPMRYGVENFDYSGADPNAQPAAPAAAPANTSPTGNDTLDTIVNNIPLPGIASVISSAAGGGNNLGSLINKAKNGVSSDPVNSIGEMIPLPGVAGVISSAAGGGNNVGSLINKVKNGVSTDPGRALGEIGLNAGLSMIPGGKAVGNAALKAGEGAALNTGEKIAMNAGKGEPKISGSGSSGLEGGGGPPAYEPEQLPAYEAPPPAYEHPPAYEEGPAPDYEEEHLPAYSDHDRANNGMRRLGFNEHGIRYGDDMEMIHKIGIAKHRFAMEKRHNIRHRYSKGVCRL